MSSNEFLANFVHLAHHITRAERGMAVDNDLRVCELINLDQTVIERTDFSELAAGTMVQAIQQQEPVITNNMITDPASAPVTNTNFSDLRVIVAIPVGGLGAIYLDQHIRNGIIARATTDRLMAFGDAIVANGQTNLDLDTLMNMYQMMQE